MADDAQELGLHSPDDRARLEALEVFARLISIAAGGPWIDNQISQINAELAKPNANATLLNYLLATLQHARQGVPVPAAATPQDEEVIAQRKLIEEVLLDERSNDRMKSWEQLIIGLGYGAFFALWSTMGSKLPRNEILVSGVSMGVSLLLYISLHLFVMVWHQTWQIRANKAASDQKLSFSQRLISFRTMQFERYEGSQILLIAWRILFPLQVIFGFFGALGLVFTAVSAVIGSK